jgi:ubiquinone/menaquinone biosynthesis C-methylase UbiE
LLDIGAGTGHVAVLLQGPGRTVIGCDIMNLLMLPLPYVLADGGQLPFLDASFEAALLITVLHHVSKSFHSRFLVEAARVLKPGGALIVMEDTFHSAVERAICKFSDSIMNVEFTGHPHANRTLAEWVDLMTQAGFHVQHQVEHVAWYGTFRMRHGIAVGVRK